MKTRLLFVCEWYETGGMDRDLRVYLSGFDPDRYEVHLLLHAPEFFEEYRRTLPPFVKMHKLNLLSVQRWQDRLGEFRRLRAILAPMRLALMLFREACLLANVAKLTSFIRRLSPDAIHVFNGGYPGGMVCLAAAIAGRRVGVAWIDMYVLVSPLPRRLPLLDRIMDSWVGASVNCMTANATEPSRELASLRGMPEKKLRVIYTGIEETNPARPIEVALLGKRWRRTPSERLVIMACRFVPIKGHRFLVQAVSRIAQEFPNVRWILVGDGPEKPRVIEQIELLHLEDRVVLPGLIENGYEAVEACDILVQPSLMEGLPRAILEAMRAAKPVIATRVGGNPELVEDGVSGLLIAPADPESLAFAMRKLLNDPEHANRLGKEGRRRFEARFTAKAMRKAFEATYPEPKAVSHEKIAAV